MVVRYMVEKLVKEMSERFDLEFHLKYALEGIGLTADQKLYPYLNTEIFTNLIREEVNRRGYELLPCRVCIPAQNTFCAGCVMIMNSEYHIWVELGEYQPVPDKRRLEISNISIKRVEKNE